MFSSLRADHKLKTSGKELFDAAVYRDNELTSSFHDMVRSLDSMVKKAIPTAFHHLLASLAKQERLLRLYSQNVDCIENQLLPLQTKVPLGSKGPWPKTIQLHGGLEKMVCSKCGWLGKFDAELFKGSEPPDCNECVEMECVRGIAGKRSLGIGKLRPRIVLYNEYHPDSEAIGCVSKADLKTRPDALVVVGTSLKVPGIRRIVREMCKSVQNMRGGITMWINEEDPPLGKDLEGAFDLIVKGDCEKVAALAALPRWDGSETPDISTGSSTPEFMELSQSPVFSSQLEVQIPQKPSIPATPKKSKAPRVGKPKVSRNKGEPKKPRGPKKKAVEEPQVSLFKSFKIAKTLAGTATFKQQQNKVHEPPTPPLTDSMSSSPPPAMNDVSSCLQTPTHPPPQSAVNVNFEIMVGPGLDINH